MPVLISLRKDDQSKFCKLTDWVWVKEFGHGNGFCFIKKQMDVVVAHNWMYMTIYLFVIYIYLCILFETCL